MLPDRTERAVDRRTSGRRRLAALRRLDRGRFRRAPIGTGHAEPPAPGGLRVTAAHLPYGPAGAAGVEALSRPMAAGLAG